MTVAYKGYEAAAGRFVLLKTVRPDLGEDADLIDRFEEEGRLIARVRHPNVVAVYASGRDGRAAYLVTEFVEGLDLRRLVERGPLPPELAAFVLLEAARGLSAVHAGGILHRDLKPANVLVSEDGAVKLADFGLASLAPDGEAERAEAGAEVRGTLAYLTPEVVRGSPPSAAADLFALGAILFELLTGRAAFARATPSETLDAVVNHDPIPALEADPRVPPALLVLAAKLLAKDPAARIGEAEGLVARLEQFLAGYEGVGPEALAAFVRDPASYRSTARRAEPVASRPPTPARVRPPRARRWALTGLAALGLLALGVGAVQLLAPSEPGVEARPEEVLALNPAPAAPIVERPAAEPPVDSAASFAAPPEVPEIVEEEPEDDASSSPDVEEPSAPAAQDVQDVSPEAPAPGSLAVAAVPWARVFVDGEDVGETPVEALSLPPGRHEVRLENPEFPAHAITVDVAPGEAERLAVSLWALVGRVTLEVHPWARVAVDGTHWDTVPPQQRPLVLAPGTHRLTLEHDVLGTYETTVSIAAGEVRTLRFNLAELLR